jgi:hypothetical protein
MLPIPRPHALVAIALIGSLIIACDPERPIAVDRPLRVPPLTLSSTFYAIEQGANDPNAPPISGTAGGISWTLDEDWLNCTVWTSIHFYSGPWFYVNEYNSEQNGPLKVNFAKPVKNVTVNMGGMDYDTHYMVGYNAEGQVIGQKTFVRGPPDEYGKSSSVETLDVNGIRKVFIYPARNGGSRTCAYGTDYSKDGVLYNITFEPGADLRVSCPTTLRGAPVNCVATSNPSGGNVAVTEWQFISPELTDTIKESSGALSWNGKAALSGTVRAIGSVDGVADTAETTLTVIARNWSTDTVLYFQEEMEQWRAGLPGEPTNVRDFGVTWMGREVLLGPENSDSIPTGPNQGVSYLTKVPVRATVRIALNRIALVANSTFYFKQFEKRKPQGHGLKPWCARSDVPPQLSRVIAHEGLAWPPPPNSHAFVFRDEMNKRVPTAIESAVALGGEAGLVAKVFEKGTPAWNTAATLADDAPPWGTGIVPPSDDPCVFQYFPPF